MLDRGVRRGQVCYLQFVKGLGEGWGEAAVLGPEG